MRYSRNQVSVVSTSPAFIPAGGRWKTLYGWFTSLSESSGYQNPDIKDRWPQLSVSQAHGGGENGQSGENVQTQPPLALRLLRSRLLYLQLAKEFWVKRKFYYTLLWHIRKIILSIGDKAARMAIAEGLKAAWFERFRY